MTLPIGTLYALPMKISLEWLSSFLTWTETESARIAEALTIGVAEIEEVEHQGELLRQCCVGRILSLAAHPKADRLSLATVRTDLGDKTVVCGGTNLREGMLVAFAHIGATVLHGNERVTIESAVIRGKQSDGMICAAEELGLLQRFLPRENEGQHPVIDLSDTGVTEAQSLREALHLTDTIFHVSNKAIPHRPDLFSHLGFARECVALGLATWKEKPIFSLPDFPSKKMPFRLVSHVGDLVPRYLGCIITIDDVGKTPPWMVSRLEATGVRSINLAVDITNYVLLEIGMPLHSFDADDLRGDVHLRTAKAGESVTTLDSVSRPLPPGALVLSDDTGIFDLLGIMGGLRSSTKPTTRRILLQSAVLSPVAIRRTIIATGHRTDAATVYEKGVSTATAMYGFSRALSLFLELVPGAKIASALESFGEESVLPPVSLTHARTQSVLGMPIAADAIERALSLLECTVESKGIGEFSVTPPPFRNDLKTPWDLIEEVARIRGLSSIPDTLPTAELQIPLREQQTELLRRSLADDGCFEVTPLSLLGPKLLVRCCMDPLGALAIQNPLGEEHSLFQPSTLPRLLEHAERAILQVEDSLATFTISAIFDPHLGEQTQLGVSLGSRRDTLLIEEPFLRLKAMLLLALSRAGFSVDIVLSSRTPMPMMHPGRFADIVLRGEVIGSIFEIHPAVSQAFGLTARSAAATVTLTSLLAHASQEKIAEPLAQFPAITYDLTIPRTHAQPFENLRTRLVSCHPLLVEVAIADLYQSDSQPKDTYNLTLRCTYRAPDRTLVESEAKAAHEVVTAIASKA